ncbi:hypothetical protein [Roseibium aggregatum]|uniref:hypothetical protein n=1 Tax=Roseibium aggregatum TaxID=187304 RepID=UPI003A97BB92
MTKFYPGQSVIGLITAGLLLAGSTAIAASGPLNSVAPQPVKLTEIDFAPRNVTQAEIGYFRFEPGQVAPVHHHLAPAIGLVARGRIIFQAEGEQARIIDEGAPFYEPAGPRILRFDNMSATEEAVFIDFSLEREGEPFIAFDEEPTGPIDRRSQPTVDLGGQRFGHVDVHQQDLPGSTSVSLEGAAPVIGIVSQGVIELQSDGGETRRLVVGETFALTEAGAKAEIVNGSDEATARLVTYRLR